MPDDSSPNLSLPLLMPSQAQKHVTHNEALLVLDALVQLAVVARDLAEPPDAPDEGARYIVPASGVAQWGAVAGAIACRSGGTWAIFMPQPGWRAWVIDEGIEVVWQDGNWQEAGGNAHSLPELGINATPDAVNRLSVSSPATLLNHEGAGHQLKINKAAEGDTASLLFQSNWSGRAEMGLAGSDAFAIKVSADGAAWQTAVQINTATGTITGSAVTQNASDATAGRVMVNGAHGLGGQGANFSADATGLVTRLGRIDSGTLPATGGWHALHLSHQANGQSAQIALRDGAASVAPEAAIRHRDSTGAWAGWNALIGKRNLLGTVTQASGVPTGAVIERGSNANGQFTRYADGTQICWHSISIAGGATTAAGALFTSAEQVWTYPAAFFASPAVQAGAESTAALWANARATNASAGAVRLFAASSWATAVSISVIAIGRWF